MKKSTQYTGAKIEKFFFLTKKVLEIFELKCIFYRFCAQNAILCAANAQYLTLTQNKEAHKRVWVQN